MTHLELLFPASQVNRKTGRQDFCSQRTRARHSTLLRDKGRKRGRVRLNFPARLTSLQVTARCHGKLCCRTPNRQNDLQKVTVRWPRSVDTRDAFISNFAHAWSERPARRKASRGRAKQAPAALHTPTCTVTHSPLASWTPRASRTRSLADARGLGQETEEQRRSAPSMRRAPSMVWPAGSWLAVCWGSPLHSRSPAVRCSCRSSF